MSLAAIEELLTGAFGNIFGNNNLIGMFGFVFMLGFVVMAKFSFESGALVMLLTVIGLVGYGLLYYSIWIGILYLFSFVIALAIIRLLRR